MAEIIKINDNTWRIEDTGVRFFLLEGTQKALLIDTGMKCPDAKEIALSITKLPLELLNTHADPDHISGNAKFEKFYMSPNEADNFSAHGRTGEIIPVKTGSVIDLGDRPLEIIDLPGHTPGSIAVLDKNNRILFSGDVIQDSNIFMFGPARNLDLYITSFQNLDPYMDQFDVIYPSHGSIPVLPDLIPKLKESAQSIKAGTAKKQTAEMFGNPVAYYKFECAGFLCEL